MEVGKNKSRIGEEKDYIQNFSLPKRTKAY